MGNFGKRKKLTRYERWVIFERTNGHCAICGVELEFNSSWHADHIVPFSQTGRTEVPEMQATCPKCNLAKGDKNHGNSIQDIYPCYRKDRNTGKY